MTVQLRFVVVGAIFFIALGALRFVKGGADTTQTTQSRSVREILPAAVVAVVAWLILWGIELLLGAQFLAGGPEENAAAEASRWSALAYFAAMVVGMIAQTLWQALQDRQPHAAPKIDKWEFVKPALVAPIVFVAVYQNITQTSVSVAMLLFSFQNGFFWQAVLKKRAE